MRYFILEDLMSNNLCEGNCKHHECYITVVYFLWKQLIFCVYIFYSLLILSCRPSNNEDFVQIEI
jgi:hypothetical protein